MMLPVKMEMDKINLCKEQSSMKYDINREMDKIWDQFCEKEEQAAPQEVQEAWRRMERAFDEYLAAVSEDQFCKGFRYAVKLAAEKKFETARTDFGFVAKEKAQW